MHRIVIIGAGAMGCYFAARLVESGAIVRLIDVNTQRLNALARDGITISDDHGARIVPIEITSAASIGTDTDMIILFTKSMHSADAIRGVSHLAQAGTYVMTLQNGLGNAETIAEVFPSERVLFGVTDIPADLTADTSVSSHGHGRIALGPFQPQGLTGAKRAATRLQMAGLDVTVDAMVESAIWEKLAFNAALNALAAVTGLTVGGMDAPAGRRIAYAIMDETIMTATAKGLLIDRERVLEKINFAMAHHRGHKASMLQDRLAGRMTEIDSINGAVANVARALGIKTPVNETMADLVRLIERPGNILPA
jgi:2-dehydropantoate 2-reductase